MADKIQRSVYYYELLAQKHTESGLAPNQAQVYSDLAKLVGECASYEEIQSRMKAEGYWEKPAQALYLDKMHAREKAAREFAPTLDGAADLYRAQHDRVAADYQAAYVTGWDQDVAKELNRVGDIVGALDEMLALVLQLRGLFPADPGHAKAVQRLRDLARRIEGAGSSFAEAVGQDYFRKHSVLGDEQYAAAVRDIQDVLAADPDRTAAEAELQERSRAALEVVKSRAEDLKQMGREFEGRCTRTVYLAWAPEKEPGEYDRKEFYSGPV